MTNVKHWERFSLKCNYERDLLTEGLSMCLVLTNPVEILAVQLVKQGIESGGFCTGHPSNYYLLLSNPYIVSRIIIQAVFVAVISK